MKKILGILVLGLFLGTQILAADDVYYCLDDQFLAFSGKEKSFGEVKHYKPQKFQFKFIENTENDLLAKLIMTERGENTEYKCRQGVGQIFECTYWGTVFVFNRDLNIYSRADVSSFGYPWKDKGDMWMSYGTCGKY